MDMINNRQLDIEVLKEPRGFLRCLQWFFAMLAFATCCDFSTKVAFDILCKEPNTTTIHVQTTITYPFRFVCGQGFIYCIYIIFRIDHNAPIKMSSPCGIQFGEDVTNTDITFPGNFSSDAQFFVFTGVVTWLYCFAR